MLTRLTECFTVVTLQSEKFQFFASFRFYPSCVASYRSQVNIILSAHSKNEIGRGEEVVLGECGGVGVRVFV